MPSLKSFDKLVQDNFSHFQNFSDFQSSLLKIHDCKDKRSQFYRKKLALFCLVKHIPILDNYTFIQRFNDRTNQVLSELKKQTKLNLAWDVLENCYIARKDNLTVKLITNYYTPSSYYLRGFFKMEYILDKRNTLVDWINAII